MNVIVFLPLTRGQVTTIDFEYFERFGRMKWCAMSSRKRFYAIRSIADRKNPGRRRIQYLHREILNPPAGMFVDHKNGDSLDNQIGNLREATYSQNGRGFRFKKRSASKFRGVNWDKQTKTWRAKIRVGKQILHLGRFNSEEDAARAWDSAASKRDPQFHTPQFS